MITWYKDNKLKILFDKEPDVDIKKILPNMTDEQIEEIRKKPLILKNKINCR